MPFAPVLENVDSTFLQVSVCADEDVAAGLFTLM